MAIAVVNRELQNSKSVNKFVCHRFQRSIGISLRTGALTVASRGQQMAKAVVNRDQQMPCVFEMCVIGF